MVGEGEEGVGQGAEEEAACGDRVASFRFVRRRKEFKIILLFSSIVLAKIGHCFLFIGLNEIFYYGLNIILVNKQF